ncbi:MAG: hypothetical protein QXQ46_05145 [Thermoplasmatales archaeon]
MLLVSSIISVNIDTGQVVMFTLTMEQQCEAYYSPLSFLIVIN